MSFWLTRLCIVSCGLMVTSAALARDAAGEDVPSLHRNLAIGAQWFFVRDKIMPGLTLRGGREWIWVHLEKSLVFSTESAPGVDSPVLGSQFGGYVALSPLNLDRVEIHGSVGGDFYWLWGIHGDQWEVALSTRISAHYWFLPQVGVFAGVRAYPASTRGLELGTTRDGQAGLPVLVALGVEWRPR